MRYLIAFAAVVCLAGNAFAATPIRGTVVKGGKNPGGGYAAQKITIQLDGSDDPGWLYDPVSGQITHLAAPVPADNTNPIPGIGVVVKKNPGSSAARSMAADGAGALAFPTDMEDGNYDYTLTIPAMAITEVTGKKTASAATVTMVLIKNGDSITLRPSRELKHAINTKGTGSVLVKPNPGTGAVDAPLTPSKPQ